jgi:hypothetical protein
LVAESYFKDPLLQAWERLCPVVAARVIANCDSAPNANAASVLADALGDNDGCAGKSILVLVDLIAAELSGAKRAREKAEAIDAEPVQTIGQRSGRLIHSARRIVARQILEAFDGE